MKEITRLIKNDLVRIKKLQYTLYRPQKVRFMHKNVPYFAQWESAEFVEKIVLGEIPETDDPKWRESGAKSKLEYRNWSWSGCGMRCLQMILAHINGEKIPLVTLGKSCLSYGGYRLNKAEFEKGNYIDSLPGLFYRPFILFLRKEFDLRSSIREPLVIPEIVRELSKENFVMASVGGGIRDVEENEASKGGHLILMLGYDWQKKFLYFHNPSGIQGISGEKAKISFSDFEKFFDFKGVIVRCPKEN